LLLQKTAGSFAACRDSVANLFGGACPAVFLPAFLGTRSYPHDWRRAGETGPTSA